MVMKKYSISRSSKKYISKSKKQKDNVDKYCSIYKTDIDGKPNKNKKLYKTCKLSRYCRKYKCNNIDAKLTKAMAKQFGENYKDLLFNKIRDSCPLKLHSNSNYVDDGVYDGSSGGMSNSSSDSGSSNSDDMKNLKKCELKATRQFYKDNKMSDLYKKVVRCDNILCVKEHKLFNKNLFEYNKIMLKKKDKDIHNLKNEVDMDLITRGDL